MNVINAHVHTVYMHNYAKYSDRLPAQSWARTARNCWNQRFWRGKTHDWLCYMRDVEKCKQQKGLPPSKSKMTKKSPHFPDFAPVGCIPVISPFVISRIYQRTMQNFPPRLSNAIAARNSESPALEFEIQVCWANWRKLPWPWRRSHGKTPKKKPNFHCLTWITGVREKTRGKPWFLPSPQIALF